MFRFRHSSCECFFVHSLIVEIIFFEHYLTVLSDWYKQLISLLLTRMLTIVKLVDLLQTYFFKTKMTRLINDSVDQADEKKSKEKHLIMFFRNIFISLKKILHDQFLHIHLIRSTKSDLFVNDGWISR